MNVATDPWVGALLSGRYRVVRALGRGGAGAVYEAEQIGLDRKVAIKLMRPELAADVEQLERFRREARAAAQLGHPHIVQLFDFAEARDGEPAYLVLELVSGPSLYQLLRAEAPLAPERAVHLATQILAALGAAHAAGIVHRDIKPGNVVVAQVPGVGEMAKVLDFGIARMQESETYQRLTRTGVIIGTPRYMSPEQATGAPLDGRADLWAMGVILYASLTGRFPFEGTPSDVVVAILQSPPPPMEGVPPALEAAVLRALQKRTEDRYPSADAMSRALRDALAAEQHVSARAASSPPHAVVTGPMPVAEGRWSTRHGPVETRTSDAGAPTASQPTGDLDARTRGAVTPIADGPSSSARLAALARAALGSRMVRWGVALGALGVLGAATLAITLAALWAGDAGLTLPAAPALATGEGRGNGVPATWSEHLEEARSRATEIDPSARLAAIAGVDVVLTEGPTFGTARGWGYTFVTSSGRAFAVSWGYGEGGAWGSHEAHPGVAPIEGALPDSSALVLAAVRDCPVDFSSSLGMVSVCGAPRTMPIVSVSVDMAVWTGRLEGGAYVTSYTRCR